MFLEEVIVLHDEKGIPNNVDPTIGLIRLFGTVSSAAAYFPSLINLDMHIRQGDVAESLIDLGSKGRKGFDER